MQEEFDNHEILFEEGILESYPNEDNYQEKLTNYLEIAKESYKEFIEILDSLKSDLPSLNILDNLDQMEEEQSQDEEEPESFIVKNEGKFVSKEESFTDYYNFKHYKKSRGCKWRSLEISIKMDGKIEGLSFEFFEANLPGLKSQFVMDEVKLDLEGCFSVVMKNMSDYALALRQEYDYILNTVTD